MEEADDGSCSADSRLLSPADSSTQFAGSTGPLECRLKRAKDLALRWEARYQEAAIFLQEGFENDSFASHPHDSSSMQAYRFVHSPAFHILDVCAALLLMGLALVEEPAVDKLQLPTQGHALVELLLLLVLAMDLFMRMRWLKWRRVHKHKRIILKTIFLVIMVTEAITVAVREKSHFRITRCLRPLFLLDSYYCMGARRVARQIVQSLPPILDMIMLLLFVMLIFSIFGYFLFSENKDDRNFSTFKNSFVSLFILVTTANYPDVMMPAYNKYEWAPAFFIIYLSITLYILLNLLTAVVYSTFQEFEKKKFRKLLLHQREAVRKMFNLLCGTRRTSLPFIHFRGVLRYYRPSVDDVSCRCLFKVLNVSGSCRLSLEECFPLYEAILLRWSKVDDSMEAVTWYSRLPRPLWSFVRVIHRIIDNRFFHYFITLSIVTNCVFMLVDASLGQVSQNAANSVASVIFTTIYTMEASMKILGQGPRQYFANSWNVFDFGIVVTSLIGLLAETSHLRFFLVLRPLRLLRLLELKKRYQDIMATLFVLLPRMANVGLLLIVFFYFFAIIGMEFFSFKVKPGCCQNSPVSDYYSASPDTVYYYLNSFDNVLRSFVTLFELMVVNNWFVIMDGFVSETSEWARVYFMLFYLMSLMVVNIVVAFILDAFLFRIASQRERDDAELEGDLSLVEVSLCPEEKSFDGRDSSALEPLSAPVETRFKGLRRRTKADLSLMMYRDEIKEWCQEADRSTKGASSSDTSAENLTMASLPAVRSQTSLLAVASSDGDNGGGDGGGDPVRIMHRSNKGDVTPVYLSHSSLLYDSARCSEQNLHAVATAATGAALPSASQRSLPSASQRSLPASQQRRSSYGPGTIGGNGHFPDNNGGGGGAADDWAAAFTAPHVGHQHQQQSYHQQQQQQGGFHPSLAMSSSSTTAQRRCRSELPSPSHPDSGDASPLFRPLSYSSSDISRAQVDARLLSDNLSTIRARDQLSAATASSGARRPRPTSSQLFTVQAEDTDDEMLS